MTRRERMMKTLRGEPVDRPPFNFYEIDGQQDPDDDHPFNIFNDPSWRPLIELARERTDRIVRKSIGLRNGGPDPLDELTTVKTFYDENGSRFDKTTIQAGSRQLSMLTRRDPDILTTWTIEHLLKDVEDFEAWLDLPKQEEIGDPDITAFLDMEEQIGDSGIVMIDTSDPICCIAPLFEMGLFTVIALTEEALFHRALERAAEFLYRKTEAVARALPGRLWRICGPEYASPPYLPPRLFRDYVRDYDKPMVEAIQAHGGFARIHSHGRLKDILESIVETGCVGLDPIEPPGQGDVTLEYVRSRYGKQLTLFGNIEATDIENLPTDQFRVKVETALREGTAGEGRGFVLQPSASPYGRQLPDLAMRNYEAMTEMTENFHCFMPGRQG